MTIFFGGFLFLNKCTFELFHNNRLTILNVPGIPDPSAPVEFPREWHQVELIQWSPEMEQRYQPKCFGNIKKHSFFLVIVWTPTRHAKMENNKNPNIVSPFYPQWFFGVFD